MLDNSNNKNIIKFYYFSEDYLTVLIENLMKRKTVGIKI